MKSKWTRIAVFPLFFLCVTAQDANFGKKVKCFVIDGTVVCPGCNSRAGLTCPRITPNENKCDSSSSTTTTSTTTTTKAATDDDGIKEETTTSPPVTSAEIKESTDTTDEVETTTEIETDGENIIGPRRPVLGNKLDMQIFLYQILRNSDINKKPYFRAPKRSKREEKLEGDTCRWNGDCPCPRICCSNGEDQPMTCKRGIRLPPPWGK